jgi:two-component system NtrC family sensor kinase
MKFYLKSKLIVGYLVLIVIPGAASTAVVVHLIGSGIVREAQSKVTLDLNSARQLYAQRLKEVETDLRFIALSDCSPSDSLEQIDKRLLLERLQQDREKYGLDFLSLTDSDGTVLLRTTPTRSIGDSQAQDEIVGTVIRQMQAVANTEIMSREELLRESQQLAEQARMEILPTPHAKPARVDVNTAGMVLKAAVPLPDSAGKFRGVLYGGVLLNRNYEMVDKIKEIVYQDVKYEEKDIGTATIFQDDLRISTNVRLADGRRAVGTRVSSEVYDRVIGQGKVWTGQAFVVNDWYLTAYAPIFNVERKPIGMLYVGLLEEKYSDMKTSAVWFFASVSGLGILLAFGVAYLIADSVVKPVQALKSAASEIEKGHFDCSVAVTSQDEIGELAASFTRMCQELKDTYAKLQGKIEAADEDLKRAYRELQEKQELLVQKEKLASMGQLSAGVSHELNNPLGTILVFSHMLLKELPQDSPHRGDVEMIVSEANRCRNIVRGLLNFARQSRVTKTPTDLSQLVAEVLAIMAAKAGEKGVELEAAVDEKLEPVPIDADQFKQMLVNLVDNGVDATQKGGRVRIAARPDVYGDAIVIEVADTGCGIPEENLPNLFAPFFTTKQLGKGTGLGLAIAYGVVKMHSGSIDVDSRPGEGTLFRIRIPRNHGDATAHASEIDDTKGESA